MKEININIEGYNVNGICVGCLNYDRKMFYRDEIKECLKILGNIDVPDGLTVQICWECLAAVRSVLRFRDQISKAYDFLIGYSKQHTFMNSPKDFTIYATQKLTRGRLKLDFDRDVNFEIEKPEENDLNRNSDVEVKYEFETGVYEAVGDGVKMEYSFEYDTKLEDNDATELKSELDVDCDTEYLNDLGRDESDVSQEKQSSDDEVLLSKLKTRKKKRVKKKKKKVKEFQAKQWRRLNNLPKDLVELYTMGEKETELVRERDVNSEEFQKLKYKCDNCVIGFLTKKQMDCHEMAKHVPKSENVYQCDICKSFFLTKDNVAMHKKLHTWAFKCRQCGLITTLKKAMLGHECAKASEPHSCSSCERVFDTKSKLVYHKSICHQEKPQCDCCGKVFANKMTLKYHLKILPQNKGERPKEKLSIPCEGCTKVFNSKKSYRAHVVIHEGLSYPCPICGKLFQWKRNLARHTRNHRERDAGATHQCRDCGKTFASRDCYNNHMKLSKRHVHESAYVHTCDYCGKKFATKWCMVDHIDWDHLKRIKYQCSVCFKPFKTAKIMVAHMNNIHDGKNKKEPEGEHLCDICGKSYKTVKRLKGHVWSMHTKRTDTKVFKCSLCPATFAWQTSIYKHMKMMHDSKRGKPTKSLPVKKQEQFPLNRVQYFPQNVVNTLNISHVTPLINIVPNIV